VEPTTPDNLNGKNNRNSGGGRIKQNNIYYLIQQAKKGNQNGQYINSPA